MKSYDAKVVDIIRSQQRDDTFTDELNVQIDKLMKLFGIKFYNRHRDHVETITRIWYYLLTSGTNLQTLGEEYAGILRVTSGNNRVPATWRQILWITLHIGGESLFQRLLQNMKNKIKQSSLNEHPKRHLTQVLTFLNDNQTILIRLHQAIFYVSGMFYNFSNRLLDIRYILLRDWMQDQTSTASIKFFGYCYLVYLIIHLIKYKPNVYLNEDDDVLVTTDGKSCTLCGDCRRDTSTTPCGHLFCWGCIHKCIKYSPYCPSCREPLNSSRIVYLQNFT